LLASLLKEWKHAFWRNKKGKFDGKLCQAAELDGLENKEVVVC
jgi:hypothetical protein